MALFLGSNERHPLRIGIWVAVVFVSVLVHELGHALVGKAFGLTPEITLHGMGGTTSWRDGRDVGRAKSIAISVAGPFAGFALAALIFAAAYGNLLPKSEIAAFAVRSALWVN